MADLNEWQLVYPGKSFTFGTLASDYPMAAQVDIGEPSVDTQDTRHPTADGEVFGRDSLGGFELTFNLTTIPEFPLPAKPWTDALDLQSAFKAAWRADAIRRSPGQYATLLNVDRNRLVYGRPRKVASSLVRVRKGVSGLVATFKSSNPDFFSGTEKVALMTAAAPSGTGFTTPLTPPFSGAVGQSVVSPTNNDGDIPAWPVIDFRGPGSNYSLECFSGSTVVWKLVVSDRLTSGQSLIIDTRPWRRGATLNGAPANGRVTGTQIEFCKIPVGDFNLRFRVKDSTGQAFADVKWRDAFASL